MKLPVAVDVTGYTCPVSTFRALMAALAIMASAGSVIVPNRAAIGLRERGERK